MQEWQSRVAPSLGTGFAGTPEEVWGTKPYENDTDPTVFFGMYGFPDFYALWRHKGPRYILWAGSDIRHFVKGYWLDETGSIRIPVGPVAEWLKTNTISYVENDVEKQELKKHGIEAIVVPSFLGDVHQYDVCYMSAKPRFYTSVSGNDFALYGWDKIEEISDDFPDVEFHLYGNTEPFYTDRPNVFVHGRVPMLEMDRDIKEMTGAIRLTEFDGFSEILAKSVLWGQYPVSPFIAYPLIATSINSAIHKKKPNLSARDYYLKEMNNYPWNAKNN